MWNHVNLFPFFLLIQFKTIQTITKAHHVLHIPFHSNKHSYMNISDSLYNDIVIDFCIGTPRQCFPCALANTLYHSFVFDTTIHSIGLDEAKSSTLKSNDRIYMVYFRSYGNYARLSVDHAYLIPSDLPPIDIYLSFFFDIHYNLPDPNACIIGLQSSYTDSPLSDSLSLIDKLYYSDFIPRKSFSLLYLNDSNGIFSIGEELREAEGYNQTCKTTATNWVCNLTKVNLYDEVVANQRQVLFQIDYKLIHCPIEYFKELELKYFNRLIQTGECLPLHKKDRGSWIECNRNVFLTHSNESFIFSFDNLQLEITFQELLVPSISDADRFIFGLETTSVSHIPWIFGEIILRKHKLIFDVDNNQIGFFVNQDLVFPIRQKGKIGLMITICILLWFGCGLLIRNLRFK